MTLTQQNQITTDIKRSILAGMSHYQGVELPAPQRTGTSLQRDAYAQQAATRVFNQIHNQL